MLRKPVELRSFFGSLFSLFTFKPKTKIMRAASSLAHLQDIHVNSKCFSKLFQNLRGNKNALKTCFFVDSLFVVRKQSIV
jgi:hypothetical protein